MINKNKIFFVGDIKDSFIKRDYEILKKYFDIIFVRPPKKKIEWLKYILILARKVKQCDLTFSWYADHYAMIVIIFSKLFRKKSIVIIAGFETANVPKLDYGAFSRLKTKLPAKFVFRHVDQGLVVDLALKDDIIKNAKINGDNIDYLPTGYDSNFWKFEGKKENVVLTVGPFNSIGRVKLKGVDIFIQSAKKLSEVKFFIIGVKAEMKKYLQKKLPQNVYLIDYLTENELLQYYQMAKVYCQLSYREGLPNALCEAMLCECIPVGTNVQGVRTAIGDTGFYTEYGDEKSTVEMIKKALSSSNEVGQKARERIKKLFPIEKREKGLLRTIDNLLVEK